MRFDIGLEKLVACFVVYIVQKGSVDQQSCCETSHPTVNCKSICAEDIGLRRYCDAKVSGVLARVKY